MAKNTKPEPIQLTCDICSENYTDPLMLTCLHSFCKKCLIKRKEEQGASDGCLKCPTCNTSTRLPDGKVEGLTQNCWLAHQVKVVALKDKMSSKKEVLCDDCIDNSHAMSYCCECSIFLCSFCQKNHQRRRETNCHKLIEIGTNKSHDKMLHVPHKPMYCSQHTDEKLKFYCHTCQILVCRDCIVIGHKKHQLDDYVKVADSSKEELKQCLGSANKVVVIDEINNTIAKGNEMLQKIEKREVVVNKEIKKAFNVLQATLESRCKALLNQSKEIANKKRKGVKNQLKAFEKLKKEVCYASQLTVAVVDSDDSGEILSISKLIKDQLAHCIEVFETTSFEIAENEKIFTSLDVTSMTNDINRFGGASAIDPSGCFIDTGLAVPMATVGKRRKFTTTIVDSGRADKNGTRGELNASLFSVDGVKEEVTVTESNNCITVSCVPQRVGQFELSLKVGGQHIKGSPYQFFVKQKRNYGSMQNQCIYNVGLYTYGVAVGTNGDVYASSTTAYIQVFNNNCTAIRTIGSKGNGNGQFSEPHGLVLVDDTLYVTDSGLHRVQMFAASTGKYIGQFGSKGEGQGQLRTPYGITYDGKDHILVADYNNRRVQVFNMDGTFVQVIDCNGQLPSDVAVDNVGNIHVIYCSQHIVQVFSPDEIRTYYSNHFQNPRGITIDDEGYCFITTQSPNYLHVLDPTGNQVNLIGGFNDPWGVALDRQGYVYVADFNNRRIMKY